MTKSPVKKLDQSSYVKTNVRLPPEMHAQLIADAEKHGRSMNSEIIHQLQQDQITAVMTELAEVKAMLRKLLDRT